jgi:16S rRNA (cytidine1402-2'-O)-methyltransferase
MPGKLTLVASPIGNLGDLSDRARTALSEADIWFVEDTRVTGKLAQHLGLKKPMKTLNEHTSESKVEHYLQDLLTGESAVVVCDGGTPGISDPGSLLCDLAHQEGIEIDSVPGPSAVTSALMLSGFFAQRFAFLGFLPRKAGPMKKELEVFADSPYTLVMFESPFRVTALLEVCADALPGRRFAICRELTKLHQQIYRGILPKIPTDKEVPRKGEFTIVLEGKRSRIQNVEAGSISDVE